MRRAPSMKARYCSASLRIEMPARSTVCRRASSSKRSSGPSKAPRSTTKAGSLSPRSRPVTSSLKRSSLIHSPAPANHPSNLDLSALSRKEGVECRTFIHRIEWLRRMPNARERRLGPLPRFSDERLRGGGDSFHLLAHAIAVQHDIATGSISAPRSFGEGAGKCLHGEVVSQDEALIADVAANDLIEQTSRQCRGAAFVDGGEHHMRRHGERHIRQG